LLLTEAVNRKGAESAYADRLGATVSAFRTVVPFCVEHN